MHLQGMQTFERLVLHNREMWAIAKPMPQKGFEQWSHMLNGKIKVDSNGGGPRSGKTLKWLLQGNMDFCMVLSVGAERNHMR